MKLISKRNKINKINEITSPLDKTIKINSIISLILKVASIAISFLSIRIALEFTGSQQIYGLWLTILSVVSWLSLLNGGLSNGLRNKLSTAIAQNHIEEARSYISTSYVFISIIAFSATSIYLILSLFLDWRIIFNAEYVPKFDFFVLFSTVVIAYFFQLVLSTINAIFFAKNKSAFPVLITFMSNLLFLICLYTLKSMGMGGLLVLGFVYSITILIVLILVNSYFFSNTYYSMKPSLKHFNKKYVKELLGNGTKFFLLEISAVIIFTTDSLIITHTVDSSEVTTYQLVMKLFSVFLIASSSILVPLWSAYTHAYANKDIVWIKKTMKKMVFLMIPLICAIFIFALSINFLLEIWVGKNIVASLNLIFIIAIYIIINIWSNIFAYLLNGINKINIQLIIVGTCAIVNIPLSIYFAQTLNYGTEGVVLASVLCLLPFALAGPIIAYYEIKRVQ